MLEVLVTWLSRSSSVITGVAAGASGGGAEEQPNPALAALQDPVFTTAARGTA